MWFNIRISSYAYTIYLICFPKPSLTCSVILYDFFFQEETEEEDCLRIKSKPFAVLYIVHIPHKVG